MTPQGWKLIKELPQIWRNTPWWRKKKQPKRYRLSDLLEDITLASQDEEEQLQREAHQRIHDYVARQWQRYP